MNTPSSAFSDSKQHFLVLDALRGVAAIVVVLFHVLEVYSGGDHTQQLINHGYLAVDFFFLLSGYVMAHAYDDRWDRMTIKDFFLRRVVRLHPMIIVGMTFGGILFFFGESSLFPKIEDTSFLQMIIVMLVGYTLIPLPTSMDIRGWNEMHPLNGPGWTLFFEYIANILHGLVLRKLSKAVLAVLVAVAAAALIHMAVTSPKGDIIGGWSLEAEQLRIGFTRLLYPYMMGMLLRRLINPINIRYSFLTSSFLLVLILSFPRVGGHENLWMNGLYDSLSVVILFPLIVFIGAGGMIKSKIANKVCVFLGDISYPIYIIHYPFTYVLYAWIVNNEIPIEQGAIVGVALTIFMVLLSYAVLKFYDEPLRKWLAKRFLN